MPPNKEPVQLSEAEIAHLLKLPHVAASLASFNRIQSSKRGMTVEASVECQKRARMFERIERHAVDPITALRGFR
jgi:hypothetical protein